MAEKVLSLYEIVYKMRKVDIGTACTLITLIYVLLGWSDRTSGEYYVPGLLNEVAPANLYNHPAAIHWEQKRLR